MGDVTSRGHSSRKHVRNRPSCCSWGREGEGTNCVLGLSTHSHILAHLVLGSGSFDYGHCKRATGSSPGHAGRGCWFVLPASGEGSGHGSLSLLARQALPPVSLCSHSCWDPTFGSPKPLLASASPGARPGSAPSCHLGWLWEAHLASDAPNTAGERTGGTQEWL